MYPEEYGIDEEVQKQLSQMHNSEEELDNAKDEGYCAHLTR